MSKLFFVYFIAATDQVMMIAAWYERRLAVIPLFEGLQWAYRILLHD
jgi:hypothetical protein